MKAEQTISCTWQLHCVIYMTEKWKQKN